MKAKKEKNAKELRVRKPSFFLYWLPAVLLRPIAYILWRSRVDRSGLKKVKGPILAIGNHCSMMDIIFAVHALLPKRFNIVTSKDLFTWKSLKPFITRFRAIPKNQCAIDITAIKMMKKALESNNNVLIYPEGRTSVDGKELFYIAPSIAKFIKMMDVTVALVKSNGAYLTKPRWFHGFRKGKVVTTTSVLLTQEEVRTMPQAEIYKRVIDALQFNDHIWQRENKIKFRSKNLAKGLEYILYKCPKCSKEYQMETDNRHLMCTACGYKVEYTEHGLLKPVNDSFTFDRVDLWYDYCRKSCLEEVSKENFYISKKADFWMQNLQTHIFEYKGSGEFYMDKEHIGYTGTLDGNPFEYRQPLKQLPTLITKNKEGIDLVENDVIYRFLFAEKKWSTKYGLLCEELFAYNNGLRERK